MNKKILLTGRPGCGKTTLIKRVVDELALPAGGFYTEELRENGKRVGFKMITLDSQEALLAHMDFKTPQRLGKYGLDPSALETVVWPGSVKRCARVNWSCLMKSDRWNCDRRFFGTL
jgi:nucleoside-triphosphatase